MAAAADLDGDGVIDIVVIDDERRRVEVYYGTKTGGFDAAIAFATGSAVPYALGIADLNRDGHGDSHLDIAAARSEAPSMVYCGDDGRRQRR